jgi:hypothetical protein
VGFAAHCGDKATKMLAEKFGLDETLGEVLGLAGAAGSGAASAAIIARVVGTIGLSTPQGRAVAIAILTYMAPDILEKHFGNRQEAHIRAMVGAAHLPRDVMNLGFFPVVYAAQGAFERAKSIAPPALPPESGSAFERAIMMMHNYEDFRREAETEVFKGSAKGAWKGAKEAGSALVSHGKKFGIAAGTIISDAETQRQDAEVAVFKAFARGTIETGREIIEQGRRLGSATTNLWQSHMRDLSVTTPAPALPTISGAPFTSLSSGVIYRAVNNSGYVPHNFMPNVNVSPFAGIMGNNPLPFATYSATSLDTYLSLAAKYC